MLLNEPAEAPDAGFLHRPPADTRFVAPGRALNAAGHPSFPGRFPIPAGVGNDAHSTARPGAPERGPEDAGRGAVFGAGVRR